MTETASPIAPAVAVNLPWYCYPKQYEQLLAEVGEHEMQILHADGPYRHLRFAAPGSMMWHFDLITWPGYLTFVGDIGSGYTFRRETDMLRFFDDGRPDGHINADYWAEKLTSGRRSVRTYSPETFIKHVNECTEQMVEHLEGTDGFDATELRSSVQRDVLHYANYDRESAVDALMAFRFGEARLEDDPDERSWTDYDHQFVLSLHALLWGAKRYHASLAGAV